jgi:SAM-dependent methyltransferase
MIYDKLFGDTNFILSTPKLFNKVITIIPPNSKILDLGCGNGICYSYKDTINYIIKNNLHITGIDIDPTYIKFCKQRIIDNKLEKNVNILLQDVFEYISLDKFDYIIFSESAPLMSKKFLYKITNHVSDNLLLENGKIIFINNLIENPSLIVKFCKPLLKYIIWTDFGRILKKKEFEELANSLDKKISFEIIGAMSLSNIAKYFKYDYLYWIFNNIGLTNYDIEQYSITLE